MDGGLTLAFWGVSVLFVIAPGADWAYAISSGARRRWGVLPAVAGMLAGHLTATVVVAAGVASVVIASDRAMTVLTFAGAGYLLWLGVSAMRHRATIHLADEPAPSEPGRLFLKGLGISVLNPKVFLLFLALLPQFATPDARLPLWAQMVVLGLIHVASCAVVYLAVGYGAAALLVDRPRAAQVIGRLSGLVMAGLGVGLIVERLMAVAG